MTVCSPSNGERVDAQQRAHRRRSATTAHRSSAWTRRTTRASPTDDRHAVEDAHFRCRGGAERRCRRARLAPGRRHFDVPATRKSSAPRRSVRHQARTVSSDSGFARSPGTLASFEPSAITTHCSSGPQGRRSRPSRGSTSQPGRFAASACSTASVGVDVMRIAINLCGEGREADVRRIHQPGDRNRDCDHAHHQAERPLIHCLPPQLIRQAAGEGVVTKTDGARRLAAFATRGR